MSQPRSESGLWITIFTNPGNHAISPPHRGASPRDATDIRPRRTQGSRITAITNPRQLCRITPHRCASSQMHGRFRHQKNSIPFPTACPPWPRGQGVRGGRPALRTAPTAIARENGQRARSPCIKSILRWTPVGESAGNDRHYPKPEPGLPNYCYHESTQPCGILPKNARALGNCRSLPHWPW